jgi:hypothetical protein
VCVGVGGAGCVWAGGRGRGGCPRHTEGVEGRGPRDEDSRRRQAWIAQEHCSIVLVSVMSGGGINTIDVGGVLIP